MPSSVLRKTDLQALYLSVTYCQRTVQDPLAVALLDNRLYILVLAVA